MGAARYFKFGVPIGRQAYKARNAKVGQKGRGLRHVTYFFKFWDPLHTDFKFGLRIRRLVYKPKNAKIGQKGRGLRRVTCFYNFGTPFISLERTELETSNLVCGLISRPTNKEMQN